MSVDLENLKVPELRAEAKQLGVENYSTMKKKDLVKEIQRAADATSDPDEPRGTHQVKAPDMTLGRMSSGSEPVGSGAGIPREVVGAPTRAAADEGATRGLGGVAVDNAVIRSRLRDIKQGLKTTLDQVRALEETLQLDDPESDPTDPVVVETPPAVEPEVAP